MDTKQNENLLEVVRNTCPFDVSIIPTKHQKQLMIIKYPPQDIDLDDWAITSVHPLYWDKIYPLIKKEESYLRIRCLHYCGNKFVLYIPDFGLNILDNVNFQICYDSYGHESQHKYVGKCSDINQLISFLTENASRYF